MVSRDMLHVLWMTLLCIINDSQTLVCVISSSETLLCVINASQTRKLDKQSTGSGRGEKSVCCGSAEVADAE
jgi:hypothetical protein